MQPGSSVDPDAGVLATPWQLRHAAAELIRNGQAGEAEALLLRGQVLHPDDEQGFIDYAAIAEAAQDWPEALQRFQTVQHKFPDGWWAYLRVAVILRQMNRFDEAERVLEQGQHRIPHEVGLFIEYGTVSEAKQDWQQALERFQAVNERFPDNWWAFARMGLALRNMNRLDEADRVLMAGQERIPNEGALFIDYGTIAEERGDWPEALKRFEVVSEKFPDVWWSYARRAIALRHLGRPEDAERILERAHQRFAEQPALFIDYGTIAEERGDWPEALKRFEAVRERFPGEWWPYARIGLALRHLGRLDEAEHVLGEGLRRFPQERTLQVEHATVAEARKDWPEAVQRFRLLKDQRPDDWSGYSRLAKALRKLDKVDEAERVLEDGQARLPDEPAMFLEHAELAESVWNWAEALKRYTVVRERFPDNWWGFIGRTRNLVETGRFTDAETLMLEMLHRFPDSQQPLVDLAFLAGRLVPAERQISVDELDRLIAERIEAEGGGDASLLDAQAQLARLQGDYQTYHDRLVALVERFPDIPGAHEKIAAAEEILLGAGADAGQAAPVLRQAVPAGLDDTSITAILPGFESLGGGGPDGSTVHGCEFGFIQRHYRIEPLSLLRWSGITLPDLTRALEAGFEGVGSSEATVLRTRPSASDWAMVDTTYNICCDHTHLDHVTVPEAEAHRMMCQRMGFLSRKLIEDLEDGEKLFVYRYSGPLPAEDVLLRLAAAVNRYGSNVLLFVCRADETNPPFSLRRLHSGLMVGYMDWFALDRVGMPWNTDGWARLCRNAHTEWTAAA